MENVNFICEKEYFEGGMSSLVTEFDAFENYDESNEFFGGFDEAKICSKERIF